MDICEKYGIQPWHCVIIEDYIVPLMGDGWEDKVKADLGDFGKVIIPHPIFSVIGELEDRLLMEFDTKAAYETFRQGHKVAVEVDGEAYDLTYVMDAITKPEVRAQSSLKTPQLIRRIKPFSGADKPAGGESSVSEWLSVANDVCDDNAELSNRDKFRLLKNSLVSSALQLVSISGVTTAIEIVDLIKTTYGASLSIEQLHFQFFQLKQKEGEKPSAFLARLQALLTEIHRIDHTYLGDISGLRLARFKWGLRPNDYDLLKMHADLDRLGIGMSYPELLHAVQAVERNRYERCERAGCSGSSVQVGAAFSFQTSPVDESGASSQIAELQQQLDEMKIRLSACQTDQSSSSATHKKSRHNKQNATTVKVHSIDVAATNAEPVKSATTNSKGYVPKQRTCWNCGSTDHMVYRCNATNWDPEKVMRQIEQMRVRTTQKGKGPVQSSPGTTKN